MPGILQKYYITKHPKLKFSRIDRSHAIVALHQQAAISQKEIVFRFRKDVQSEKGWGLMSCA